MKRYIYLYFYAALILFLLDAVWLMGPGYHYYVEEIGSLLRVDPDLKVAAMFYLLYLLGIVVLVVKPSYENRSLRQAAINGGLLGLCAYGTYDLTNLATLEGFSTRIAVIDMVWGTSLTLITATGAVWLALRTFKR